MFYIGDFFDKNPRKISKVARKFGVTPQAIHSILRKERQNSNTRLSATILCRIGLNCKEDILDFLLDDKNFDENQKIKWDD